MNPQMSTCEKCAYWSETVARNFGGRMEAMCLGGPASPHNQQYTAGAMRACVRYRAARTGAIDAPGGDLREYHEADRISTVFTAAQIQPEPTTWDDRSTEVVSAASETISSYTSGTD